MSASSMPARMITDGTVWRVPSTNAGPSFKLSRSSVLTLLTVALYALVLIYSVDAFVYGVGNGDPAVSIL